MDAIAGQRGAVACRPKSGLRGGALIVLWVLLRAVTPAVAGPVGEAGTAQAGTDAAGSAQAGSAQAGSAQAGSALAGQDAAALVARAKALFLAEKYIEAADTLMAAYKQQPRPIYLFNAAQSYRKGNAPQRALSAYEQFIPVADTEQLAAEARTYARDMKTLLDAQERSQTITLALENERQAAAEKQRELEAEKNRALSAEKERAQRIAAELEQAKHPPFYKRAVFWGIVSPLLATGIAMSIALPLYAQSIRDANRTDGGAFTITLPMNK